MAVQARHWRGSPPVFIVCGEELLEDEDKVMAKRLAREGVKVVWEQYEGMPHDFGVVLSGHPTANISVDRWCRAIKQFVECPQDVKTNGPFVRGKKLERLNVDLMDLHQMSDAVVMERMKLKMKSTREN
jgi:hypothetical protein